MSKRQVTVNVHIDQLIQMGNQSGMASRAKSKPQSVNVDAIGLAKGITLEVKLKRMGQLRWRVKFACWLLTLAAFVGGFGGIEIIDDNTDEEGANGQQLPE